MCTHTSWCRSSSHGTFCRRRLPPTRLEWAHAKGCPRQQVRAFSPLEVWDFVKGYVPVLMIPQQEHKRSQCTSVLSEVPRANSLTCPWYPCLRAHYLRLGQFPSRHQVGVEEGPRERRCRPTASPFRWSSGGAFLHRTARVLLSPSSTWECDFRKRTADRLRLGEGAEPQQ